MIREALAVGLTGAILVGLVVVAQPAPAVVVAVSGPGQVTQPGIATFTVTVRSPDGGSPLLEQATVLINSSDGPQASVVIGSTGAVLSTTGNASGTVNVTQLSRTVRVTDTTRQTDGTGYGYGTADGRSYRVDVPSTPFAPGTYEFRVRVTTAGGATYSSDPVTLQVEQGA